MLLSTLLSTLLSMLKVLSTTTVYIYSMGFVCARFPHINGLSQLFLAGQDGRRRRNNCLCFCSGHGWNFEEHYRRYLWMDCATFEELVMLVTPTLQKKCKRLRKPLSVEEKLACTLRYLATGESFSSLQYQFRISKSTISLFIPEVCDAIGAWKTFILSSPKAKMSG